MAKIKIKKFLLHKTNQKWYEEQCIWINPQRSVILVIQNSMSTCLKFHQREFRPLHVLRIDGKLKGLSENHNIKL